MATTYRSPFETFSKLATVASAMSRKKLADYQYEQEVKEGTRLEGYREARKKSGIVFGKGPDQYTDIATEYPVHAQKDIELEIKAQQNKRFAAQEARKKAEALQENTLLFARAFDPANEAEAKINWPRVRSYMREKIEDLYIDPKLREDALAKFDEGYSKDWNEDTKFKTELLRKAAYGKNPSKAYFKEVKYEDDDGTPMIKTYAVDESGQAVPFFVGKDEAVAPIFKPETYTTKDLLSWYDKRSAIYKERQDFERAMQAMEQTDRMSTTLFAYLETAENITESTKEMYRNMIGKKLTPQQKDQIREHTKAKMKSQDAHLAKLNSLIAQYENEAETPKPIELESVEETEAVPSDSLLKIRQAIDQMRGAK